MARRQSWLAWLFWKFFWSFDCQCLQPWTFGGQKCVLGLLERLNLRSSGAPNLLLCFVSVWCTNNMVILNVDIMLFESWKCILIVNVQ